MKTQHEVEQMKIEIQGKISKVKIKAQEVWNESDETGYNFYDREYAKLVAQYNILCEVLG